MLILVCHCRLHRKANLDGGGAGGVEQAVATHQGGGEEASPTCNAVAPLLHTVTVSVQSSALSAMVWYASSACTAMIFSALSHDALHFKFRWSGGRKRDEVVASTPALAHGAMQYVLQRGDV